jgi:hypothetical protein
MFNPLDYLDYSKQKEFGLAILLKLQNFGKTGQKT